MENRYIQLGNTVELNSYHRPFSAQKNFLGFTYNIDKGGNSLPKHFVIEYFHNGRRILASLAKFLLKSLFAT